VSERIELSLRDDGRVDIVAPRDADFCRDALKDGRTVIVHAPDDGFVPGWVTKAKVVLEMDHVTRAECEVVQSLQNLAFEARGHRGCYRNWHVKSPVVSQAPDAQRRGSG